MAQQSSMFKVSQLAKDLQIKNKDMLTKLESTGVSVKSYMATLEPDEFNLFFDTLTRESQIGDLDAYLNGKTSIKRKKAAAAKAEKAEEKSAAKTEEKKAEPKPAAKTEKTEEKPAPKAEPVKKEEKPAPKAEVKAESAKAEEKKAEPVKAEKS